MCRRKKYCKKTVSWWWVEQTFVSLGFSSSGCNRLNRPPYMPIDVYGLYCGGLYSQVIGCTIDNCTFLQVATLLRMPFHGKLLLLFLSCLDSSILATYSIHCVFSLASARMSTFASIYIHHLCHYVKCCQHTVRMPLCGGWYNIHHTKSAGFGWNRSLKCISVKLALITISSSVIPIGMGNTNTKVLQNVYFNEPWTFTWCCIK